MIKKLLFLSLLASSVPAPVLAQKEALKVQQAFNTVAVQASPAVVSVRVLWEQVESVVEPEFFFGYMMPVQKYYRHDTGGLGSGVIMSPKGYVLTNDHVVHGADRIQVVVQQKDGKQKTYMARLAADYPRADLAVLEIETKGKETFPYLKFADEPAKVGDWAIAIGYPFGFKQTMTSGIISALGVSMRVEGRRYPYLIQTDAAINQGNSGGPLLNISGEVVGINSAIFSPSGAFAGMGFALPASEARRVYEDFLGVKPALRAWLGVSFVGVDDETAARFELPRGVMVTGVVKDSPAAAAGLRRGDIITGFDGNPVEDETDLLSFIYARQPGDKAELKYYRDGKELKAEAKLGSQPGTIGKKADY